MFGSAAIICCKVMSARPVLAKAGANLARSLQASLAAAGHQIHPVAAGGGMYGRRGMHPVCDR